MSFVLNEFKSSPKDLLIDSISSINKDIMNFLSIDCSTDRSSLFLKTKNKTFNSILQRDKLNNDLLMKQILDLFKEHNLEFENISSILVNQGPGNFSSLRGSIATAKGISLSKNLNLFGYDTFVWSCAKFFNKKNFIYVFLKIRNNYFGKKFDSKLKEVSKIEKISKEEILEKYYNEFIVIPKIMVEIFDEKILSMKDINIVNLDHNLLESLKIESLLNKGLIKPLYLS